MAEEPSERVEVGVGEAYELVVDENPTTGYRWTVVLAADARVEVLESEFEPPDAPSAGAGGRRRIRLLGKAPGTTLLELRLTRPWSAEAAEVRRIDVQVTNARSESR